MRTALVALTIVLIALAWFNPGMDDYAAFVEANSERLILQETGDSEIAQALASLGGRLAGTYIPRITDRANYVFFSTYTMDLGGDDERQQWRFLGLAGTFVELDRPALLDPDEEVEQDSQR